MDSSASQAPPRYDVLVVGLGTAGAAAARQAARRGLRVLGVDRSVRGATGARWVNGVPDHAFAAADLPPPAGAELMGSGSTFRLFIGRGPVRVDVAGHGILDVDMRALVERLLGDAEAAGASLRFGADVRELRTDGSALIDGTRVRARHIVDASGMRRGGRLGLGVVPTPRVPAEDICAASQQVHAVDNPAAADAFLREHGAARGDILSFAGVAGGYSVLNASVHDDPQRGPIVSFLAGSLPARGFPAGDRLIAGLREELGAWVGPRLFGGARPIPLRRPVEQMSAGAVVVLGDAAAQVFTAHGSGIGAGLVAARQLVDAWADGHRTDAYTQAWMRSSGGLFAAFDVFRRFTSTLTLAESARMVSVGLMTPALARAGLDQRPLPRDPRVLAGPAAAAIAAPDLARRLLPVLARMGALQLHHRRYRPDAHHLRGWAVRARTLAGDGADLALT